MKRIKNQKKAINNNAHMNIIFMFITFLSIALIIFLFVKLIEWLG
jgi:hypothetical protein